MAADHTRLRFLGRELREVARDLAAARQAESFTAVAALHRLRLAARAEYDHARAELAAATPQRTAADLSPEEWTAHLVDVARSLSDDDLDVFLSEWARRMKRVFVVEGDEVRAVRTG